MLPCFCCTQEEGLELAGGSKKDSAGAHCTHHHLFSYQLLALTLMCLHLDAQLLLELLGTEKSEEVWRRRNSGHKMDLCLPIIASGFIRKRTKTV